MNHTQEKWTNCPDRFTINPIRKTSYKKGKDKDGLDARRRKAIEAIKQEQQHLPQAYAALVDAGLKAGRLPAAFEAVSLRRVLCAWSRTQRSALPSSTSGAR